MPRQHQEIEMPNLQWIKLDQIDTAPQVRKNMDKQRLQELADDIRARGLLQPIIVRPCGERFRVIAGHRRRFACEMAGLEQIPAMVGDAGDDEVTEMQLVENLQREDLAPDDIGVALAQLYEKHASLDTVALMVNKSKSWVAKHIKIATRLDWDARKLFEEGVTEDGEFLCTLSDLFEIVPWEKKRELCNLVRAGKFDRNQARDMLHELKEERAAARATPEKPQRERKPRPRPASTLANDLHWANGRDLQSIYDGWQEKEKETFRQAVREAWSGGASIEATPQALCRAAETYEKTPLRFARMLGFLSAGTKANTFDFDVYMLQLQAYYAAKDEPEGEPEDE
jgi:ParB/RepB/Spo0J family partition protein